MKISFDTIPDSQRARMENYSEAAIVTNNGSDLHGGHLGSYDSFFSTIPPGYRFKPFDTELVVYYLKRKIANQTLPPNRIREVELYNFSPDTLAGFSFLF